MMSLSDFLTNPYLVAGAAVFLLGFALYSIFKRQRYPYYACNTLLTATEIKFYKALKIAAPTNAIIMMKVRMADIINCAEEDWKAGWGPRVSAKHIDFVLIDPKTTQIKMAIELDDSTHVTNHDRISRDKFVDKAFKTAGVPLLRITVQNYYDMDQLKASITQTIG